MDVDRRHEIPASEKKNFIMAIAVAWALVFSCIYSSSLKSQGDVRGPGVSFTSRRLSYRRETLNLMNSNILWWAIHMSTLCSLGRHYLYLPRLSAGKRQFRTNAISASAHRCIKMQQSHKEFSPNMAGSFSSL